jgi:chromosome segregation ATPase
MSEKKTSRLCRLVTVLSFTLCLTQLAAGQNQQQSDDRETLKALLTEVTLLRQALQTLQRMSLDTYRSQIMVDRIRVNRENVRRLSTDLDETRDTIAKIQISIPRNVEDQKLLENQIPLEVDVTKRAILELELRRSREAVELYKSQTERLKQREQELSAELRTEQIKLDELEGRLDLLERAIESDRQKLEVDKPAAVKKP